jgi:hypothetical protein
MIPGGENISPLALLTSPQDIFRELSVDDKPEQSRSSYWEAEIKNVSITEQGDILGDSVLGTIAPKSPIRGFYHWIMQLPFLAMCKSIRSLRKIYSHGRVIADNQNRILTLDILRQILALESIVSTRIDLSDPKQRNVVIGDGCGVMGSLLFQQTPHRQTIMVNLRKSLLVDLFSIKKTFPEASIALPKTQQDLNDALSRSDIQIIGIMADDAEFLKTIPIGLVINIVSMQEMTLPIINNYFDIIRRNPCPDTFFYCCNKLHKKLYGGEEIRFNEYPWDSSDEILFDSVSPWNQWYYEKIPPFWRYRRGADRVIWHRLARMAKTS